MYRTLAIAAVALLSAGLAFSTPAAAGETTCNPLELEGKAADDCIKQWVKDICKASGGDCSKDGAKIEIKVKRDGSVQGRLIGLARSTPVIREDRDASPTPKADAPIRDGGTSPRRIDQLKNKEMIAI